MTVATASGLWFVQLFVLLTNLSQLPFHGCAPSATLAAIRSRSVWVDRHPGWENWACAVVTTAHATRAFTPHSFFQLLFTCPRAFESLGDSEASGFADLMDLSPRRRAIRVWRRVLPEERSQITCGARPFETNSFIGFCVLDFKVDSGLGPSYNSSHLLLPTVKVSMRLIETRQSCRVVALERVAPNGLHDGFTTGAFGQATNRHRPRTLRLRTAD